MLRRTFPVIGIAATLLLFSAAQAAESPRRGFEDAVPGGLPQGWTVAKTGSIWKIQEDATSPLGGKVLTQTSSAGPSPLFNLCVDTKSRQLSIDLTVSLKGLSGKIDQGGGPVWRYHDENNYYVARVNPLENNFRVYKVIGGKRTQLATADIDAAAGRWHSIRIEHRESRIRCSLNGRQLLDVMDDAIVEPGGIGFWTKADAVTSFTAPIVSDSSGTTPKKVFVVNTQDASVSLVDLDTMQEVRRIPVGPRPYGIAVSRDGKTLAVGVEDEEKVKFFDTADYRVKGETHIGKMFNDHIVLTQDGTQIMVANFYSDDVVCIDMASMKEVYRIEGCSAPHVVKFGPLKKNLYVTCKKITGIAIVDPVNKSLVKFHQLNVNPRSLTFSSDESKIYFGSFWVNGVFEMDAQTGKVARLLEHAPPADKTASQEVTYHGVEAVGSTLLAANEGRSYVDSIDTASGKLLDRLTDVTKPCCIERIPSPVGSPTRVLVSNLGDGTLQLVEVSLDGRLKSLGKVKVGAAPKRVAFLVPTQTP